MLCLLPVKTRVSIGQFLQVICKIEASPKWLSEFMSDSCKGCPHCEHSFSLSARSPSSTALLPSLHAESATMLSSVEVSCLKNGFKLPIFFRRKVESNRPFSSRTRMVRFQCPRFKTFVTSPSYSADDMTSQFEGRQAVALQTTVLQNVRRNMKDGSPK